MQLKITRAHIKTEWGKELKKFDNKIIEFSELESFRDSLKESEEDVVHLHFEEVDLKKTFSQEKCV